MPVRKNRHLIFLSSCVAAVGLWHGMVMAQSAGIYTCVDARGRKLTSDRPIPECIDREQRELSPSGSVRRTIAPTLTAQERAAIEEKQKLAHAEIAKQQEEKRRDKVLLARYPNREAHDRVRADLEMEFYKADPTKAPLALKRQYESSDASMALQQSYIKEQEAEKNRVNARFDAELVKLNQLWSGVTSATR